MARTCPKAANQALLLALACGATVENAARKAGISERTAYRRLDDRAFLQQLDQLRADMVQRTAGMLTAAGMGSVKTLVDLQQDAAVSAAMRRRAARDVLELGIKYRETVALEQRIIALEERLADPNPREAAAEGLFPERIKPCSSSACGGWKSCSMAAGSGQVVRPGERLGSCRRPRT